MIKIEYAIPTAGNNWRNDTVFAKDAAEAESICKKIDEYYYRLIDVSEYIEWTEGEA